MKTLRHLASSITALTLSLGAFPLHAQDSARQLANNSKSYNPAYGQVSPSGFSTPSSRDQYYTPGEYLPTPGSRPEQVSQTTTARGLPQQPYAYPGAPATTKAQATPPEDLEALRRENQVLSERLRAQMAQDARGYLSPPSQPSYVSHTIRRGDTLWGLAIKYRTSSNAIVQANQLPNGQLLRGTTIRIPVHRTAAVPAPQPHHYTPLAPQPYELATQFDKPASAPNPTPPIKSGFHVVKSGETVGILAQHYGVTINELKTANQLRSAHRIYIGQQLIIPGRSVAEVAELSQKTIPTTSLAVARTVSPPYSYPGRARSADPITGGVPAKEKATHPGTAAPKATTVTANRGVTSYRVQETDSHLSIAKLYKISPAELRDFNRLPSDKLPTAGKTLLVPTPAIVSL